MTVLVAERIERPLSLFGPGPDRSASAVDADARKHDGGLGGGRTLDDAIVGAWEGLAVRSIVACPLCGGTLRACSRDAAGGGVSGGRCDDCDTTLA
jgi:hypothetical protein